MNKQLELDAVPRRRVRLVADEPAVPKKDEAEGYVFHRPPRRFSELKYRGWDVLDEMPPGWKLDVTCGSPLVGHAFITDGRSALNGGKRALLKLDQEAEDVKLDPESSHAIKRAVNAVGRKAVVSVLEPMTHAQDVEVQYASQEISRDEADAKLGELTDWAEGPPPCTGWWDFQERERPSIAGYIVRLWFDAVGQQWRTAQGSWIAVADIPFVYWRGLPRPAEHGYSYHVPGTIARQRGFYARGHRVELKES